MTSDKTKHATEYVEHLKQELQNLDREILALSKKVSRENSEMVLRYSKRLSLLGEINTMNSFINWVQSKEVNND